ncbi:MAG TPA: glycosyltransferase [Gaiellaceae bacterium]|nr:glycosyltransferase [Gaiellaceae bacterium]
MAGIPWTNVQALRRKGVDARLVVVERQKLHPEADVSLDRPAGFWGRQAVQWPAFLRLLPKTDVFHFYFGWTLVPRKLTWPILKTTRRRSVLHFLGSDIRGRTSEELAYARGADARIVGSYDALRWMPDAEVVPPGLDLRQYIPADPVEHARPVVLHAPSSRRRKGTEHVIAACESLDVELDIVEGLRHDEARTHYERADIVVDQLNAGWYGIFALEAMALGKPVLSYLRHEAVEETERALGVRVPIVPVTKETLRDRIGELAADAGRRRELGAASRGYVERVHDADEGAGRLLELYRSL